MFNINKKKEYYYKNLKSWCRYT